MLNLWMIVAMGMAAAVAGNAYDDDTRREHLSQCLCYDADKETWCNGGDMMDQCQDYAHDIYALVWPCGLGIVFVLFFPFLLLLRRCCNTCGGAQPSRGCMCPSSGGFEGYSFCQRLTVRVVYVILLSGSIALLIVAAKKADELSDGVRGIANEMGNVASSVNRAGDTTLTAFHTFPDVSQEDVTKIEDTVKDARDKMDSVDDARKKLLKYDHEDKSRSRYYWSLWFIVAALSVLVLGFFVMLCGIRKCLPMSAASMMGVVCIFVCLAAVAYELAGLISRDMCHDYDLTTGEVVTSIKGRLGCYPTSSSGLYEIINRTEDTLNKFGNRVCTEIVDPLCSAHFSCVPCQANLTILEEVVTQSTAIKASDPSFDSCPGSCPIEQCAVDCGDGPVKDMCTSIVGNWTTYAPVFRSMRSDVYPVADCTVLTDFQEGLRSPLCDNVKPRSAVVFGSFLAVSLMLCGTMMAMLLATKRFAPDHLYNNVAETQMYPPSSHHQTSLYPPPHTGHYGTYRQ